MKKSLQTYLCMVMASFLPSVMHANVYTFTSAGATGREGPTQAQVDANYTGTTLDNAVTINTQGIQEWTVPVDGNYTIEALGASGGSSSSSDRLGGKGAKIKGTFNLTEGTLLKIVVGHEGLEGTNSSNGARKDYGGGGGTFVMQPPYNDTSGLLIAAGGGGGAAGSLSTSGNLMGNDATDAENGTSGISSNSGAGGTNGSGGSVSGGSAGAGAGFLANGSNSNSNASGKSVSNGALGGFNQLSSGIGGFGGGGGGWHFGGHGGGGGGFSGGGTGGSGYYGGGGGGSYNSGTDQNNTAGANEGHGKVIITLLQPTTYTFTSAGATGRYGPTQSQVDANYSETNLDGAVTINTQGIQEWTVPADGNYVIEAWGAQGANNSADLAGAFGAKVQGTFSLNSGILLKILVGQKGTDSTGSTNSSAGGGGTFVTLSDNTPMIIAGGGGGRGGNGNEPGVAGTTDQNGTMDSGGYGQPGTNGQGGISGSISNNNGGGGGGGLLGNGLAKKSNSGYPGFAFVNGGTGGSSRDGYSFGGFGGGGGNHESSGGGGGGGGYSGGTGGQSQGGYFGGGGGGSYNSGTDQSNTAGANEGHGKVIITLYSSSSNPSQSPVITQGAGPLNKTIDEDTNATWTASELNATDSDTQASSLAWSLLTSPTNGTATVSGNGSAPTTLSYQPNADYHGADSFSVQVTDGENNDSITIHLTINPVEEPFNGSFNWSNHAGGSDRTEAFSVDVSNDGSSLISGMFFGTANFGNSISLSSTNDADGFTAKMNADGTFAWATKVGCTSSCRVADVAVLADGSSIITGHWSGTATFGNTSLTTNPTSYNDVFVAKLDANGNFLWVKQTGGTASDEAAGIAVFGDGSSVVTGGFSGTVDFGVTTLTSTNHLREIFVAKLDSNGNYLWASKAGGAGHDNVRDLTTVADGSTFITGDFASTANFGNFSLNEFGAVSSFVAKLDANGSFLWATKAGENQCCSSVNAYGLGVEASTDGSSIIVTGHFQGECNFGDNTLTTSGSSDVFVAKLDSSGNYVWIVKAGGTSSDIGRSATLLTDGSSLITGQFQGTALFGDFTLSSSGSNDVFVGKLDSNGTFLWALKAGGSSSDYPMKISSNDKNEVIAAGIFNQTATFGNSDLTSLGSLEAFVVSIQAESKQSPVITQGAGPLSKTLDEDSNATWTASELNATDSDTNASSLTWSILSSPSNGFVTVDGNGSSPTTLSYQPNADYHGSDSFSVQVSDGENNDSITIDLTINPVDDATSIIGDDNETISEDISATGDLNATDADGLTDGSYFSISTTPTNGSAFIDPVDGNWTYSPNPNFFGSDSFVVSVTDDLNSSTTTTVSLSVSSVDDVTSISGDSNASIAEDSSASGDLNATDQDGLTDGSYFSISSAPSNGSASIDPTDGNWTYSPNPNFFGSDSFVVSITDDLNTSTTTTINLSISSVDDATILSGDFNASTVEDGIAYGDLNVTDLDGLTDGSYFAISTAPANGSAFIDPVDGNWTYSPNPNFFGSDSFVVSVTDDLNSSTTTTVSLSVSSVDDVTSISGDSNASIAEDSSASGDLNATDADGLTDGSYFSISITPTNGSAFIDPVDGNWTYSPNPNFFGSDSFVVSVTDDLNSSTTTTVSLSVSSVDDVTSISGDTNASIAEDSSASGDLNATDLDGLTDGSYFAIFTAPASGSASIDPVDGNWTYSPNPNFFGSDSFVVSITDDLNTSTTTTINLSVSSVDDTTIITGDTNASLNEEGFASGDLIASDADGLTDGSYFSISTVPANGSASIDPVGGNWTYSPNPNFFGSDSFAVSITDDLNTSSTTTVNLFISAVDDATSVSGDTQASIAEDTSASGDLNATDADGLTDGSYFSISTAPANGSAAIDPVEGNWTYSPHPNFFGSDSFAVSITDDLNTSSTTTVNLSISAVDDATSVSGDTQASIAEDTSASGDLNATDADGLTDGSYFSISTVPANGSASIDPTDGNWTYSPNPNFFGSDSFVVSVTDDLNISSSTTINLTITEVAEPDSDYTSPDSNYSTTDDQYTSPDVSTSSPDSGYQSPTESYSSPDSNYTTQDDSVSSPDSLYATPDDSVSSPDDQYASPEYHLPVVETGQPSIDATGFITLSGSVHSDGGSALLEVGFLLSPTLDFNQSERVVIELDSASGEFILQTSNQSAQFVRAFAANAVGESLGQLVALESPSSESPAWADAQSLPGGWLQSDWLGTFQPFGNGWIFHARLGWLYVPSSADEGLWLWSSTEGWIWTQRGIAPHFFDHGSANWLYLLPAGEHEKTFYDYSIEDVR